MTLDVALVIQNAVRRDGQGRVMVELAHELARRGHDITIYAHRLDDELADQVAFSPIPQAPGPQIVDDVAMLARATARVRRAGHDVACVLGHSALPSCPTVLNVQFSHQGWRASWKRQGRRSRPGLRHRLHVRVAEVLERRCLGRADRVIASTPVLASEIVSDDDPRVRVVPNGVDLTEFGPLGADERAAARRAFGLRSDEFVVAFLGDYATPRKGLDPLILALALGPVDERLVVAARGDDRLLRRLAEEAGVADRVVVVGFVHPRSVLAASDVLAAPSLYEPFSLVAFEAAASGVPVVISACAGAAPLLGEGAFVVDDPTDPAALRSALDAVRADPALAGRAVAAGRRAAERLTWEVSAAQAADVIEEVARGSG